MQDRRWGFGVHALSLPMPGVLVCPLPHTSVPTYRMILARAREHPPASTQRVWMKSAIVEREAGDAAAEAALLEEGLTRFPTAWKLHLMAGALAERQGEVERARAAYHAGIKRCLDCVPLWIAAAALEEREGALGELGVWGGEERGGDGGCKCRCWTA